MNIDSVITGGVRHSEMVHRLRIAGFDDLTDLSNLTAIKSATPEHIYILATYTAMLEMREILAKEHLINGEMK